jgi:hypothetical protein
MVTVRSIGGTEIKALEFPYACLKRLGLEPFLIWLTGLLFWVVDLCRDVEDTTGAVKF